MHPSFSSHYPATIVVITTIVCGRTLSTELKILAVPAFTVRPCAPRRNDDDDAGLDAALIHSTIDAIPSPNGLLGRMGGARGIVREDGGIVVVVSAYEWNEDVTPEGAWLGGYVDKDGNEVRS